MVIEDKIDNVPIPKWLLLRTHIEFVSFSQLAIYILFTITDSYQDFSGQHIYIIHFISLYS
jgi:hypothetical protein